MSWTVARYGRLRSTAFGFTQECYFCLNIWLSIWIESHTVNAISSRREAVGCLYLLTASYENCLL